jgi:hypothetical protein
MSMDLALALFVAIASILIIMLAGVFCSDEKGELALVTVDNPSKR